MLKKLLIPAIGLSILAMSSPLFGQAQKKSTKPSAQPVKPSPAGKPNILIK